MTSVDTQQMQRCYFYTHLQNQAQTELCGVHQVENWKWHVLLLKGLDFAIQIALTA